MAEVKVKVDSGVVNTRKSKEYAQKSEAWAVGKVDGVDVPNTADQYHNNSKYYKEIAMSAAATATDMEYNAEQDALNSEAYAVGKRNGSDVTSGDPAYHNNSKYFAIEAYNHSADADNAKIDAVNAKNSAASSKLDSEAYAVGTRNGTAVTSGDPAYHNNAKYYKDQSASYASDAHSDANYASGYANQASASATTASGHANAAAGSAGTAAAAATAAASSATAAAASASAIAATYDSTKTYAVGEYCLYNGGMYVCTTAITTAEAWTAGHWSAVKVGTELTALKEDFTNIAFEYTGRNLLDYTKLELNKYLNPNGTFETYNGRCVTDYIPVVAGKIVTLSYLPPSTMILTQASYAAICCFDANKNVVSGGDYNRLTFTVPNGVAYVRITVTTSTFNGSTAQIELTNDGYPTQFEYYYGSDLQLNKNIVISPKKRGYMRTTGNLGNNESLNLPYHNVKNNNVIAFSGNITSFDRLKIGKQTDTYIIIDGTNVTYYNDQGSSSEAHGLTIANDIQVVIKNEDSYTIPAGGVRITSSGHTFESTDPHRFLMDEGSPYATSLGSALTDCVFSWTSRNINKPIWLFGDSYFSWYTSRWTYYLAQDGYTDSCMLNGYAGEGSVDAMAALRSLLNVRVPEMVVWCLGMNNADSSSAVNPNWYYNYTALVGLANYYGFKIVLATIPNTPTINNSFKNALVKNSGYRYIDFESAVNVGNDGSWIPGTLDNDNTHPTEYGARVLYGQVLVDLPEIVSK